MEMYNYVCHIPSDILPLGFTNMMEKVIYLTQLLCNRTIKYHCKEVF